MNIAQNPQSFLLKALEALNAGNFDHINGKLLWHLKNTYNYLLEWGNREALCVAGLYHAVYSTDGYAQQLIDINHRSQIIHLIGVEAENIVYHYAACERGYFYPRIGTSEDFPYRNRFTGAESFLELPLFCDLLELTLANEIEIVSSSRDFKEKHRDWDIELFRRFEPYVSTQAFRCYQGIFSH